MREAVARMYKQAQYAKPEVHVLTAEETLARQARKATRFLNCRILRPSADVIEHVTQTGHAIGYKIHRLGPGRPKRVTTFDEALEVLFELGAGKIVPILA